MRCKTCLTVKDASAFYVSNKARCKECVKEAVTAHRNENIERARSYDRLRAAKPHRVAARSAYQATPEGRLAHKRALKASAQRYPARAAARIKFRNSVRDGKVEVWPCCAVPECAESKVEGHHPDYSQPLSVVWLCNPHHRAAHALSIELEKA